MRRSLLFLVSLALLLRPVRAEIPPAKCFDGTSDRCFSTAETIPYGGSKDGRMPQVEKDASGQPIGLSWVEMPKEGSVKTEQIGSYRGKGIHRFLYRRRGDAPGEVNPLAAVFGLEAEVSGETVIRPFFIMEADTLSMFEAYFSSSAEQPFAFEIHTSLQGTPDLWSAYTVLFAPGQAWLSERSQGGRNRETEVTRYDKTGKVVSTRALKHR